MAITILQLLLGCLIITTTCCSGGAVRPTNKRETTSVTVDKFRKITARKHLIQTRQDDYACLFQLHHDIPSYCNASLLLRNILMTNQVILTDAQLTELNNAYSQSCVAACLRPVVSYWHCTTSFTEGGKNYRINRLEKGICGQQDGDYCEVRYIRQYLDNLMFVKQIVNDCTINDSGVSCNSATPTCLNLLANLANNVGCCTEPYLGPGVELCSGVSVDQSCTGVSSATGVAPVAAISLVLLSLLGLFF